MIATFALALVLSGASEAGSDAFVAWAKARALPLEPAGEAEKALDPFIRRARLIGLGESVHESEPFLSFRVRILKDLIRRHRLTAIVYESGLAEAMAADDYVTGRTQTVDFSEALSGGHGHLAGIREFMEWVREWNRTEGRARPVHVYGADVPGRQANMVPGLDGLTRLATGHPAILAAVEAIRPTATAIGAPWWRPAQEKYNALSAEAKAALREGVLQLLRETETARGIEAERLAWIRRVAITVEQYETMVRLGAFSATSPREQAMAANLLWILGRLGEGERAAYVAHNAHVQRVSVEGPSLPPGRFLSAGELLAPKLGDAYVPIGTTYIGPARNGGEAAPAESLDAVLSRISSKPFLLPIGKGTSMPGSARAWLRMPMPMRFQVQHLILNVDAGFDALAFFDSASPAPRAVKPAGP